MPRPNAKRSPQNLARRKARVDYEMHRARTHVRFPPKTTLKNAGTPYEALMRGVSFSRARKRFTVAELAKSGVPYEWLLAGGASPETLQPHTHPITRNKTHKEVVASRMRAGHRTSDILKMKRHLGLVKRRRTKK